MLTPEEQLQAERDEFFKVLDENEKKKADDARDSGGRIYAKFQEEVAQRVKESKSKPVTRVVDTVLTGYEGRTLTGLIVIASYYVGKRIFDDKGICISEGQLVSQAYALVTLGVRISATTYEQLTNLLNSIDP